MQRSLLLVFVLLLALAGAAMWWFQSGADAPPPMPGGPERAVEAPVVGVKATDAGAVEAGSGTQLREAVVVRGDDLRDDPAIRAALCGFRGRVVDGKKQPVPDCGVRLYRAALDSVLKTKGSLFEDDQEYEPDYIAGEARTATDGTFVLDGVWPRGVYILFAGLGTDAPTHQFVERVPSPGEVVDLGDIVLNDAGVITGTVLDDRGEPLAGALVRAADVPGAVAALFPFERIDPEGAVLIRERGAPVPVVRMPAWAKRLFEHLPIPTTRSGEDGRFRLVGVLAGSNMLATTAGGFLSDVKASVLVRGGQTRDVGAIRLRRGEELSGQVVDSRGEPVAGAEVLAGSTLAMAPFDLAQSVGSTDAEGRFEATGFVGGKVTVAARRSPGHPWVLAAPQPIFGDVTVTLPATGAVVVTVNDADGKPTEEPEMRLLHGERGEGAAEMFLLGLIKPVPLDDRCRKEADGRWRIDDLLPGQYTLLVRKQGVASASAKFEIGEAEAKVALTMQAIRVFKVRVVDDRQQPIRNATLFAEARGQRVVEMPLNCGRTDAAGRITIDEVFAESLRVSAEHPAWGVVHGEVKPEEELTLQMQPPGSLRGFLFENGKPTTPGSYTIAAMWRRGSGARGPLEATPILTTAAIDGSFVIKALQPGEYSIGAMPSVSVLRSPGSAFAFGQAMYVGGDFKGGERITIVAGEATETTIEVGDKPIEGPTAQLLGSVTLDGQLAAGATVIAHTQGRRFGATVDDRGRFDLGVVPAGKDLWVMVSRAEGGLFLGPSATIWSSQVQLAEAEVRELTIDVTTTTLAGTCVLPDGSPARRIGVQANGRLRAQSGQGERGSVWLHSSTDDDGAFRFERIPEGTWNLEIQGGSGEERWVGSMEGIEVQGGLPVTGLRVPLKAPLLVKGRIELAGITNADWMWLGFWRLTPGEEGPDAGKWAGGGSVNKETGAFVCDDLTPGTYRVTLMSGGEGGRKDYPCGTLLVPDSGVSDAVLVPQVK